MPQLSLYLSDDLAEALKRRAESDHRSLSNFVGRVLSDYLSAAPCPDCGSTDPGHATPCARSSRSRQVDLEELTGAIAATVERGAQARTPRRPGRGR